MFSPAYNVPFDDDTMRKRFYVALEGAGLGRLRAKDDPIVFHDLRHTFGTLAVQAFALSDVKAMMGHADISTTMIYGCGAAVGVAVGHSRDDRGATATVTPNIDALR